MLLKCCTQYASKFGKLNSGNRTGKGFQSQRKAMQKNVQTTAQLNSFHMLAMSCSKCSMLGFKSPWTENYRCTSWIQKMQRNQRSNCQHLLGHRKSKRISEKTSNSALLTMSKPLTMCITIDCGKFLKRQEYQTT